MNFQALQSIMSPNSCFLWSWRCYVDCMSAVWPSPLEVEELIARFFNIPEVERKKKMSNQETGQPKVGLVLKVRLLVSHLHVSNYFHIHLNFGSISSTTWWDGHAVSSSSSARYTMVKLLTTYKMVSSLFFFSKFAFLFSNVAFSSSIIHYPSESHLLPSHGWCVFSYLDLYF